MDVIPSITAAFKQVRADIVNLQRGVAGPDLYSKINWGETIWVAHRCGSLVYPEQCAEALEAVYQTGGRLIPEIDIQELADGTFVLNHDPTVGGPTQVTTNVPEGPTENLTPAQWRQMQIKPAIPGGSYGTPLFWEDVMDKYGGKMMMFVELKAAVSTTSVDRFCKQIVERGLKRAMIVFCFEYEVCRQVASYGIEVLFLKKDLPTQTPAQMLADGIRHIGTSAVGNMTKDNITTFKTAGIKVMQYTIETRDLLQATLDKGVHGIISNDPWWHSGMLSWQGQDPFNQGIRPHGMEVYGILNSAPNPVIEYPLSLIGRGLGFPNGGGVNTRNTHASQPWAGKFQRPCTIGFKIQFGRGNNASSGQSHNAGFSLHNIDNYPLFVDDPWPGQQAFTFVFRRSGIMQAYQAVNGALLSSNSIGVSAPPAGGEFAAIGQIGTVYVEVVLTTTTITMYANTSTAALAGNQTKLEIANSTNWGNMALSLRFPVSGDASISDVRVNPHPPAIPV